MDIEIIKTNDKVLLVWGSTSPPTDLEQVVTSLRGKVGENGLVQVEHYRLIQNNLHTLEKRQQHLQELLEQLIVQQLQLTQQVEKLLKQLYPKVGQ